MRKRSLGLAAVLIVTLAHTLPPWRRPIRPGQSACWSASSRNPSPASFGPAGISPAIVSKLNAVINESLQSPEVAATLEKLAVDAKSDTLAAFAAFLAEEMTTMTPVIKAAGLLGVE
jgi:Tripartite tricarboxylate transporter family receptor